MLISLTIIVNIFELAYKFQFTAVNFSKIPFR